MIKKFIISFFIFLLGFVLVKNIFAVVSTQGGGGNLSNPIEDILKKIPGEKPPIVGVTCGQAVESPTDQVTDVNLCCVAPKQFDAEKNAINVLSNFMCLPTIASVPTRIVGGVLGAINPLNKIKGFGELFSGKILDGLGDITGLKSIFGLKNATDPLCIGDIASGLANRITQQKSFITFQKNISSAGINPCQEGAIPSVNKSTKACICRQQTTLSLSILCANYVSDPNQSKACQACALKNGIYSGVGCIGTNASGFVATLMTFGIGLAGISAFLCIIYSAFLLQTSRGNPERVKKAREYLTNCIIGLLIIIFAVFILKLVGIDILQIAGLV